MPSINIFDTDLTTPGTASATNFTVVIPGFVDATREIPESDPTAPVLTFFEKYVDGIAEFSSRADFQNDVGTIKSANETGYYATLKAFEVTDYDITTTVEDPETGVETTITKTAVLGYGLPSGGDTITSANLYGHLFRIDTAEAFETARNNTYKDQLYTINLEMTGPARGVYKDWFLESYNDGDVEHPHLAYYFLTKVADDDEFDANTNYVVVEDEGVNTPENPVTIPGHGNQIAEELLNMGYNIIFVGIPTDETEKLYAAATYEPLTDKSAYSFRFIISGFNDSEELSELSTLYGCLIWLAETRGDCIALLDIDEANYRTSGKYKTYKNAVNGAIAGLREITGSKNAAVFTPAVNYGKGLATYKIYDYNGVLPASFHYLTCFYSATQKGYAEWYAVAGENRGVSDYSVVKTTVDFGANVATILEPRSNRNDAGLTKAANVITKFKNTYILWGNRVANSIGTELTAGNFLNVRHLVTTLKQELYSACKRFSFDPNSDVLWLNFCNAIRPVLDRMKANEGVRDYKILKLKTDLKATFKARIRIIPIEAVEDFNIEISLEDSFGSTVLGVEESL